MHPAWRGGQAHNTEHRYERPHHAQASKQAGIQYGRQGNTGRRYTPNGKAPTTLTKNNAPIAHRSVRPVYEKEHEVLRGVVAPLRRRRDGTTQYHGLATDGGAEQATRARAPHPIRVFVNEATLGDHRWQCLPILATHHTPTHQHTNTPTRTT